MNKHFSLVKFELDRILLSLILLVLAYGIVMMYSAANQLSYLVEKKLIHTAIGLTGLVVLAQIPPRYYERMAVFFYGISVLMLCMVLLWGDPSKGAQRWLNFAMLRFQPSEISKVSVPLLVAHLLSQVTLPPNVPQVIRSLLIIAIPAILIALQPDLGTAILVATSGGLVIFLSGISWKWIGFAFLGLSLSLPIFWFFLMHDYQRRRILILLNPLRDAFGSGYHIIQSKIAIGSGGLLGKGWQAGTQAQLKFIPECHTDFIFAVLAEEFGFVGVSALLLLYLAIVVRALQLAECAPSTFGRLLAGSISLTFFFYLFVNIGMVSGLLPIVGVPLPLLSHGGSAQIMLLGNFGILISVCRHRNLLSNQV